MEHTEESATRARKFIFTQGRVYGKAKSDRTYLEHFLKSKLALLMAESTETTMTGKEMYAKAHPDYLKLLDGIREAIELEETLKWQLISAQATIEIYRTESANNRTIDRAMQ
jgi:capsule polysaccharide export protein KpsE/RkpR